MPKKWKYPAANKNRKIEKRMQQRLAAFDKIPGGLVGTTKIHNGMAYRKPGSENSTKCGR